VSAEGHLDLARLIGALDDHEVEYLVTGAGDVLGSL
jgi:hypothetical protein